MRARPCASFDKMLCVSLLERAHVSACAVGDVYTAVCCCAHCGAWCVTMQGQESRGCAYCSFSATGELRATGQRASSLAASPSPKGPEAGTSVRCRSTSGRAGCVDPDFENSHHTAEIKQVSAQKPPSNASVASWRLAPPPTVGGAAEGHLTKKQCCANNTRHPPPDQQKNWLIHDLARS